MEPRGAIPHSQGISSNPHPQTNQPKSFALTPVSLRSNLTLSSHLRLGLPKGSYYNFESSSTFIHYSYLDLIHYINSVLIKLNIFGIKILFIMPV